MVNCLVLFSRAIIAAQFFKLLQKVQQFSQIFEIEIKIEIETNRKN